MHPILTQEHSQYTAEDNAVWSILYERQWAAVHEFAYDHFEMGLKTIGLNPHRIPAFEQINERLLEHTGWKVYPVPGLIPNGSFFKLMVYKRFGATTWIRKREQLDYLEEPDLFHDTFGHIPLLADPIIAQYLHSLALIAERYIAQEEVIEMIARQYWYTIEFGLVNENGECKIYGAGILSSIGETQFCLSQDAYRVPFDLEQIIAIPYIKDKFQEQYFVLDSMDQLTEAVIDLDEHLKNRYA